MSQPIHVMSDFGVLLGNQYLHGLVILVTTVSISPSD